MPARVNKLNGNFRSILASSQVLWNIGGSSTSNRLQKMAGKKYRYSLLLKPKHANRVSRYVRKCTLWHVRNCAIIRIFDVRLETLSMFGYPKRAQWRFWSDCANAQADLNLRWALMSGGTFPWAHISDGTFPDITAQVSMPVCLI